MRLLLVALVACTPSAAGAVSLSDKSSTLAAERAADCPKTTHYHAWRRDEPLKPQRLTELPPATTYMAVVRTVNGCERPLTLIEYRRGGRR